jgi:hypothetical protein
MGRTHVQHNLTNSMNLNNTQHMWRSKTHCTPCMQHTEATSLCGPVLREDLGKHGMSNPAAVPAFVSIQTPVWPPAKVQETACKTCAAYRLPQHCASSPL